MTIGLGPRGTGILRMVRPGVLLHWCFGCQAGHTFDVHALMQDGKVNGWCGSFSAPNVDKPLRYEMPSGVCEYLLKGGVQYFLESCSAHELAGQSRHLIEFPLP